MKHSNFQQKQTNDEPENYFDLIRNENYDKTFSSTENWLRKINSDLKIKNQKGKYFNMKNYFKANKFKLAYTFLILAFLIAACNYPVTQEETAGDIISWTVDNSNAGSFQEIEKLEWLKNGSYNINEMDLGGNKFTEYKFIVPEENHKNIEQLINDLKSIPGIRNLKVTPLSQTVKKPVYAAVLDNVFKIHINASDKNDKEAAEEISTQLKNAGVENVIINFITDEKGRRRIDLSIPESEFKKDGGFDITIKDGENVNRIKELRKSGADGNPDKFKGKSDSEIRNIVRQDLENPDIKDDQIEIIRDGEKIQVKVKVENIKEGKTEKTETEEIQK